MAIFWILLVGLSSKEKNYKTAVYFLEKSVSILPRSSEVIDHLGDCYFMLNRKKKLFSNGIRH